MAGGDSGLPRGALGGELEPALVGGGSVYLTGEDQLRVSVLNAAAAVRAQLSGRLLNTSGEIVAFTHDVLVATDRSVSTLTRSIGEGWLLEASVRAIAGTPLVGQCYAILSIVRGQTGNVIDLSTLGAGYVTAVQRLAWPGAGCQSSLDGGGALRSISGATPGAGAEISETVPTGARWELIAFSTQLVTSVAAGVRRPQLTLDDGANVFYRLSHTAGHAANVTFRHQWFAGSPEVAADLNANLTIPLPIGIRLGSGHRIKTVTVNIDVADQWSLVQYLVREWIEGA